MEASTSVEMASRDWFSQPCMLGIDEAGRGPVLGPMVYGCAFCPVSLKQSVATRAFADSKTLSEEKRESLFKEIQGYEDMGFIVDSISARVISGKMLQIEKTSLNAIANESTFYLIQQALSRGVNLTEVYVDTVGDSAKWQSRLSEKFPGIQFTVCPKADSLYPIVSAASIMAKVTRDRELKAFTSEEGLEMSTSFGSGYPHDEETKGWLRAHLDPVFGFPSLVRFSWQTCSRILEESGAEVKWECEEPEGQTQLDFSGKRKAAMMSTGASRHSFFRMRKIQCMANDF